MTKDEALKLALEALEANQPVNYCLNSKGEKFPMLSKDPFKFERNAEAITAIKQARAAPDLQAELEATNRQVEILSDALSESQREVAALKAVQEPVFCEYCGGNDDADFGLPTDHCTDCARPQPAAPVQECLAHGECFGGKCIYTTPPAAQPAPPECQTEAEKTAFAFGWWKALESVRQPAVPDAFGTREGEHSQYVQGWNDCRAEMLKGMKP
jgi:hypothetical protein